MDTKTKFERFDTPSLKELLVRYIQKLIKLELQIADHGPLSIPTKLDNEELRVEEIIAAIEQTLASVERQRNTLILTGGLAAICTILLPCYPTSKRCWFTWSISFAPFPRINDRSLPLDLPKHIIL